jgi:lipid II:glycine glycyltransferase (peptidoglycan interpeptide bridge formation enzyme)
MPTSSKPGKTNQVISSKLIITYGHVAHSLLSGTDELGRKLRVPALVQWESMREALKRDCTRYSIGGASSSESDYPSIKRVTKYKQGFGGEITVHSSLYDAVFPATRLPRL